MAKLEADAVLFITPNFLTYYRLTPAESSSYVFPPGTVVYQEVLAENQLSAGIQTFLAENKFTPGKLIILLSDSMVFYESIAGVDVTQQNTAMEQFYKYVPVAEEDMAKHVFVYQNATYFVAFDKRLLLFIKKIFESAGWQIILISPVSIFGLGQGDQLPWESVNAILPNDALLIKSNLPFGQKPVAIDTATIAREVAEEKNNQTDKKKITVLVICLLCFYIVSSYAVINSGLFSAPSNRRVASIEDQRPPLQSQPTRSVVNQDNPTQPQTQTQQPTPAKSKDTLTVLINSASLSALDTAKVKLALEGKGFTNISTDGGTTENNTGIKVLASRNVSPQTRTELTSALATLYPAVQIFDAPTEATVDIIIYIQ